MRRIAVAALLVTLVMPVPSAHAEHDSPGRVTGATVRDNDGDGRVSRGDRLRVSYNRPARSYIPEAFLVVGRSQLVVCSLRDVGDDWDDYVLARCRLTPNRRVLVVDIRKVMPAASLPRYPARLWGTYNVWDRTTYGRMVVPTGTRLRVR